MRKILFALLMLSLAALACSLMDPVIPGGNGNAIETSVAATLAAERANPPGEDAAPQPGTVTGGMCYPSEGIPPMTLYLENADTQTFTEVPIAQNQATYSADVPPGNYIAYAWLPDFGLGGSYSQAVPCGLDASCTDHSLITFSVASGQTTSGVDICDWYGNPGSVPLPPGSDVSAVMGSISGNLSYPSEFIPPLDIVAFDVNSTNIYAVSTQENQSTYTLDVPPGVYHVYAYVQGDNYSGAYNQAVLCGLSVECTDASMIEVFVGNNQDVTGIDPGDWYSDQESRPPNPNN